MRFEIRKSPDTRPKIARERKPLTREEVEGAMRAFSTIQELFLRMAGSLQEEEPPEEESQPTSYEFFITPRERDELFNYCAKVAEYLKSEQIANLVIIDRSSRPMYIGVREYWRAKYPEEQMPGMYFMNPKGFKARENLTEDEILSIREDAYWKDDADEAGSKPRSQAEILTELDQTYTELAKNKQKPLLVFDSCLHTGNTLAPVIDTLRVAGYEDVRVGTVSPGDPDAVVNADLYLTTRIPVKGCYPFDQDRAIEKTFTSVYSQPTIDPQKRQRSSRLRREIRRIVKEAL